MFKYSNKGFWGGEKGHVHGLQEFGVVAAVVGLLGWFISPLVAAVAVIYMLCQADQYWIAREVNQSLNMGRKPIDKLSLVEVPCLSDSFWTQDAIADVEFPRSLRWVWWVLSAISIIWMIVQNGIWGLVLRGLF